MKPLILKALYLLVAITVQTAYAQKAVEAPVQDSRILKQLPDGLVKNPVYLKGNLAAWVNDNNEFVVYAETKEKKYLFVLQMESTRKVKPATGKFTELTFLGDSMILNDGKSNYYFGIGKLKDDKAAQLAHLTEKDFTNFVEGYGLSRHQVPAASKQYSLQKLKAAKSVLEEVDDKK